MRHICSVICILLFLSMHYLYIHIGDSSQQISGLPVSQDLLNDLNARFLPLSFPVFAIPIHFRFNVCNGTLEPISSSILGAEVVSQAEGDPRSADDDRIVHSVRIGVRVRGEHNHDGAEQHPSCREGTHRRTLLSAVSYYHREMNAGRTSTPNENGPGVHVRPPQILLAIGTPNATYCPTTPRLKIAEDAVGPAKDIAPSASASTAEAQTHVIGVRVLLLRM